jgi:HlyD family secretion protein
MANTSFNPSSSDIAGLEMNGPSRAGQLLRAALGWTAALVAVGGVALGVARYRAGARAPALRYETALVDQGPLDARVTATGAVSPLVLVQVGSQVSGRLAKLYVDFGSTVKRGQTVASIDPSLFQAAVGQARANYTAARAGVERARAELAQAERQYARDKLLVSQGLATQAEYDAAESNAAVAAANVRSAEASVAQARAALAQAELNLTYTTIASPIDGIVISRNVDVGQTVAAALQAPTLFTIAQDLTKMQVDANVAEADIGKLRAGMRVTFTVDAYPGRKFEGVVRQLRDNAQTIQNVVTYDTVIDVDNFERLLKPGMTANVTMSYANRERALRAPVAGLRFKPDRDSLSQMLGDPARALPSAGKDERLFWVLRGTTPIPVVAHVGLNDGSNVELTSGDIHPGDRVIVEVSKKTP